MIALGVASEQALPPPMIAVRHFDGGTILGTKPTFAATPGKRLALQTRCAQTLPAFLPFPPSSSYGLQKAKDWADKNQSAIKLQLSKLANKTQLTLSLRAPHQSFTANLRQKAQWLDVRSSIRERLESFAVDDTLISGDLRRPNFDLLINRHNVKTIQAQIHSLLAALDLSGWSGVLIGPLAPVSFCQLEPME